MGCWLVVGGCWFVAESDGSRAGASITKDLVILEDAGTVVR